MLAAFRWNLRVLSYVALIVGAFLIYNTISVSVVRRRNEIGVLRALGATRGAVLSAFLGEAACFGVIGGLIGCRAWATDGGRRRTWHRDHGRVAVCVEPAGRDRADVADRTGRHRDRVYRQCPIRVQSCVGSIADRSGRSDVARTRRA